MDPNFAQKGTIEKKKKTQDDMTHLAKEAAARESESGRGWPHPPMCGMDGTAVAWTELLLV